MVCITNLFQFAYFTYSSHFLHERFILEIREISLKEQDSILYKRKRKERIGDIPLWIKFIDIARILPLLLHPGYHIHLLW
jgi:hypothetical protein